METLGKSRGPTIKDIAQAAGVSKSAVSRALLGQGEVSQDTRERVERAAREMGYVANAMARGLVSSSTHTLGVVLRDVANPFYANLYAAMQREAEKHGYRVVTATSAGELELEDALGALRTLISLQVDGLVIASAQLPSEDIVPFMGRVPIVVAGRRESSASITSVYCDDEDGGQQMADLVAAAGHRRVAVILVDKSYSLSQNIRGLSMIDTLRSKGVAADVYPVNSDSDAPVAASSVISHGAATAVMCPTDASLVAVLEVFRELGLRAPEDISATGYDALGPLASPFLGLTSFHQPIEEIATTSVDLLLDMIKGSQIRDRHVALRGSVSAGRTLGPPREPGAASAR
ncbi:LacI family DNA-binding transcriptional regulator [bacterium RCC_150]